MRYDENRMGLQLYIRPAAAISLLATMKFADSHLIPPTSFKALASIQVSRVPVRPVLSSRSIAIATFKRVIRMLLVVNAQRISN